MIGWRGWLALGLWLTPVLGLIVLGGLWLWQQGWFYRGMGVMLFFVALAYTVIHWPRRKGKHWLLRSLPVTSVQGHWSEQDIAAWRSLQPIRQKSHDINDTQALLALSNVVLTTLAGHYHQKSRYPALEFPLPYLLRLIALVCRDLETDVLDKIPGSHALTVSQMLRIQQTASWLGRVRKLSGAAGWLWNWPGAALGKAKDILLNQGIDRVKQEVGQRLLDNYIDRLGYYAIQLYGGHLSLDDMLPDAGLTAQSEVDLAMSAAQPEEPLRILLLGQVSSGKSSLIDALFGTVKTASSRLPTTAAITPYLLEKKGKTQAIILDSPGFGEFSDQNSESSALAEEWRQADLILWLVKANQADRAEDSRQIQALRRYFTEQAVNRAPPVIIAVVTHIDQLRPISEWQPPYNIEHPDSAKAKNIRAVCDSIAEQLDLPTMQVVPVCLAAEGPVYNVDDGLSLVIDQYLNDAQRARYLRCLRHHKSRQDMRKLRQQLKSLGQMLFD